MGLTKSSPKDIQSPPGNSLAIFVDGNTDKLMARDINGKLEEVSKLLPENSASSSPTLPDVFLGFLSDTNSISDLLDNYNLTVTPPELPVLFVLGGGSRGSQVTARRYLWKLGSGEFNPIGGLNPETKLELIAENYSTQDDIDLILSGPNAQEVPLGVINEDFITYMNNNGPYVLNNSEVNYVITFTKDDIDYAYLFSGTPGTYGVGNTQLTSNDFIFIYQSTVAGEPVNPTYLRITRAEAETLQSTASFVPGSIYTITNADVNLYGGTEITLTAITPSELSLQGTGLFYCPKYDLTSESNGYGIWTKYMEGLFFNVLGSFSNGETVTSQNGAEAIYLADGFLQYISGDWSGATSISGDLSSATADVSGFVSPNYAVNDVVHWGGKSWTNVNGNIGASVDKYTLDSEWTEIPFNSSDYNVYADEIQYDFHNDMIIYRKDRYNNVVSGSNQVFVEFQDPDGYGYGNPIKDFQWGCAQDNFNTTDYLIIGIQGNFIENSYMETLNFRIKYIWNIYLKNFSAFFSNIICKNSYLDKISGEGQISENTICDTFFKNLILKNGNIYNSNYSNSQISNTEVNNFTFGVNLFNNCNIQENNLSTGSIVNQIWQLKNLAKLNCYDFNININISSATVIFNPNFTKIGFSREDGQRRLQYVNNSDVIVIANVTD